MAIDIFARDLSFNEIKSFLETHKKLAYSITIHRNTHHTPPIKSPTAIADTYIASYHFYPIGKSWREVPTHEAVEILTRMLSMSMAYNVTLLSKTMAKQIATQLVNQFDSGSAHYLINTQLEEQSTSMSWMPVADATFDSAVVLYDSKYIGMICMEDED